MDLTVHNKVVSGAESFVSNFQNGLNKIDAAIALLKYKPAPNSSSLVLTVQMSKKHKTSTQIAKKKYHLFDRLKVPPVNVVNFFILTKVHISLSSKTRKMM